MKDMGTYACLNVSVEHAEQLKTACDQAGIDFNVELDDLHCTVIYSRKPVNELINWTLKLPISTEISSWEILGHASTGQCLVGIIEDPRLQRLHKRIVDELGATHDYPEYKAHVTVCTDYTKNLPNSNLKIKITFDNFTVEPLDLTK